MRKMIAFFLALLLVLPCIGALAEEENFIRRAVPYPGEDFSIAIPCAGEGDAGRSRFLF